MLSQDLEIRLRALLAEHGYPDAAISFDKLVDIMTAWYATERMEDDWLLDPYGDGLLVWWGFLDLPHGFPGDTFLVSVTRQVITQVGPDLEDGLEAPPKDRILQLRALLRFTGDLGFKAMDSGQLGCFDPEAVSAFRDRVRSLPVAAHLKTETPTLLEVSCTRGKWGPGCLPCVKSDGTLHLP